MSRIVFLDTETTGLDDWREELFEAAIIEADGTEHVWTFEPLASTVENMHPKAAEVNRYHERTSAPDWTWNSAEDLIGALYEIHDLLDGAHVVGAVPDFDTRFIRRLFERYAEDPPRWSHHLIDVEAMALGWLAGVRPVAVPWRSNDLAAMCGVAPPSPQERHTALGDARWVKRWYERMTNGMPEVES